MIHSSHLASFFMGSSMASLEFLIRMCITTVSASFFDDIISTHHDNHIFKYSQKILSDW